MADHPFTADDLSDIQYGIMPAGFNLAPFGDARITDKSRWAIYKECIVTDGFLFYKISWDEGATESQDSSGEVEITRVYPHEVTITEYRSKP